MNEPEPPTGGAPTLWRQHGFVRLWWAATLSNFGTMVTRLALPLVAIQTLDATPLQVSWVAAAALLPACLLGLHASAWIDRLPRRPVLVAADLGRAVAYVSVPIAAALEALHIEHLYLVALVDGGLGFVFAVAHQAYLPGLVTRARLLEANSKLRGAEAVTEAAGFAAAGWLVQILTAPMVLLLDAASFLASAACLGSIRTREPPRPAANARRAVLVEVAEGLRFVLTHRLLRPLALSHALLGFGVHLVGAVYLLFVNRQIGFAPGVIGAILALGAVSSLLGAVWTRRVVRTLGTGPAMIAGLAVMCLGVLLLPLIPAVGLVGYALLVLHQASDGAEVVYDVSQISLRQTLVPDALLGRVSGGIGFATSVAMLLGTLVGGALGETLGLRAALWVSGLSIGVAALLLALSGVRTVRHLS